MIFFDEVMAFNTFHGIDQEVLSLLAVKAILVICGIGLIFRTIFSMIFFLRFIHISPDYIQSSCGVNYIVIHFL